MGNIKAYIQYYAIFNKNSELKYPWEIKKKKSFILYKKYS